jgi:formylglycine-generating enzyme required for sulfatase activity
MLPDTSVWKNFETPGLVSENTLTDSTSGANDYNEHYLRYPGYRYFPVVGVSYHQASEYCKWRSAAVNSAVNKSLADKKKSYRLRYTYSLASIADLEYASRGFSGKHQMNRKTAKWTKTVAPGFDSKQQFWNACVRQPVAITPSGKQVYVQGFNFIGYIFDNGNQWNFYNVLGNVSEITDEEGKSFGGAWIHEMDEILRHKTFGYTKPEYWLGFRCAATVEIIR